MTAPSLKVFLDDERQTPAGWTRVYWPAMGVETSELMRELAAIFSS